MLTMDEREASRSSSEFEREAPQSSGEFEWEAPGFSEFKWEAPGFSGEFEWEAPSQHVSVSKGSDKLRFLENQVK